MASLRELRKSAGLTQKRLAYLLDVSTFTIIRWEQGQGEPGVTMTGKLAWALRTDEATVLAAFLNAQEQRVS